MQASKCAGERTTPGFENPWGGSHEVQNRGNQWPTKWTLVQQKFKKNKQKQKQKQQPPKTMQM